MKAAGRRPSGVRIRAVGDSRRAAAHVEVGSDRERVASIPASPQMARREAVRWRAVGDGKAQSELRRLIVEIVAVQREALLGRGSSAHAKLTDELIARRAPVDAS